MMGEFSRENGIAWAVEFLKRPELLEWPKDKLIVALLLMPSGRAVWDAMDQFGKDVEFCPFEESIACEVSTSLLVRRSAAPSEIVIFFPGSDFR
jgi:hypothetical protein